MKPYSLFKSLLYSLTSVTAARFGEIVIRASSRSSKNYRTALLVYLLLQITIITGADLGGGCRGCAPPPEMTCGFLIQLRVEYNWYSEKKNYVVYWC